MKHATREYEIQKKLSHPRIVRLLDVFEVKSIHLLISERRVKNTLVTRSMPRRPHRHTGLERRLLHRVRALRQW